MKNTFHKVCLGQFSKSNGENQQTDQHQTAKLKQDKWGRQCRQRENENKVHRGAT